MAGNLGPSFGEIVKRVREERGMSAPQLAAAMGKDATFIYRIEGGSQEPTIEQVNRFAYILRLSVEDLLLALGANITPPEALVKIPTEIVQALVALDKEEHDAIRALLPGLQALRRERLSRQGQ